MNPMNSTADLIACKFTKSAPIGPPDTLGEPIARTIWQRLRRFHDTRGTWSALQAVNVEVAANCCLIYLLAAKNVAEFQSLTALFNTPGAAVQKMKSEQTCQRARKTARKILIVCGYLPKLSFSRDFDRAIAELTAPL